MTADVHGSLVNGGSRGSGVKRVATIGTMTAIGTAVIGMVMTITIVTTIATATIAVGANFMWGPAIPSIGLRTLALQAPCPLQLMTVGQGGAKRDDGNSGQFGQFRGHNTNYPLGDRHAIPAITGAGVETERG